MKECKHCKKEFINGLVLGGHQAWCKKNPNREKNLINSNKDRLGIKLSTEHKKKISEGRLKFLKENPEMVPYKLNHKHKETFPEKYFRNVLKGFVYQFRVSGTLYEIDFANPENKIGIEIDGEQHYVDPSIVNHDIKRTEVLNNLGWRLIRIRWSEYKSLPLEDRKDIISMIMENSFDVEGKIIHYLDIKKMKVEKSRKIQDDKNKGDSERREYLRAERKIIIMESGIDFAEFGWATKVSKIIGTCPQIASRFIRTHMKEFYMEKCHIRKIPKHYR